MKDSEWVVGAEEAGVRLDKFLAAPERTGSRGRAVTALERGKVLVNGAEAGVRDAARRLVGGDVVRVWVDRPGTSKRRPEALEVGIGDLRILFVHILPNVLPIILAYVVLDFAFALVNLAGLSFLGLGVEPGTPDWGRMLFENRTILFTNPVALLLPAAMVILTAVSMNLIGDWLFERLTR